MKIENSNNPLILVVFGATGDLYQNKLSVSLFNLFTQNLLPKDFRVIGFARRLFSDLEFQNLTRESILNKNKTCDKQILENFLTHVKYVQGDLTDLQSFQNLSLELGKKDRENKICSNKLFYLAVPPNLYEIIFKNISEAGLAIPCARDLELSAFATGSGVTKWTRILVEKPFGKDMDDAKKLDQMLGRLFDEMQIFRIDHYLAKKNMRNLMDFSFSNGISKSLWNNQNIEYVKIALYEDDTLKDRANFYDGVGALRDVGQNHVLQMLALVAMEAPDKKLHRDIHEARNVVFQKTSLISEKIVHGQYEGYLQEKNVEKGSKTETFFRVILGIDNSRWQGVPFILESGKALDNKEVFVEVCFKNTKGCFKFLISSHNNALDDAYEKVFYDCILGDQTIFVSTGEVMAQWKIVTDIIQKWQSIPLVIYKKGSKAEEIK